MPFFAFLLLVEGGFTLGFFLPFLLFPMPLGEFVPPFRGFQGAEGLKAFLGNALIASLVARGLPLLEGALMGEKAMGLAPRLYVLLSSLVVGVLVSPYGLPQGKVYLLWVLPLGLLEYLALALAAYGRLGPSLLLLGVAGLYEAWVLGVV